MVFAANDDVVQHLGLEHLSCADEVAGDGSSSCLWLFEWTAENRPTGGQFLLGSGCGGKGSVANAAVEARISRVRMARMVGFMLIVRASWLAERS